MIGLYIHIPFCQSRCIYCDFVSSTLSQEWQAKYLRALEDEMFLRSKEMGEPVARTIYIGGGTPSQLSPQNLAGLMDALQRHFTWQPDCEFTLEANPDDITPAFISCLRDTPVNRISMGIQSTDDSVLRFLRRRHTARQAFDAIGQLQEAGYENISGDLIYGLPHQSLEMFEGDLKALLQTGIPHLSAYALQYEPGTPLYQMLQQGEIPAEDEEHSLRCYEMLMDFTAQAGMEHYEISNFARSGYRSRHNSSYWQGRPYLGLGAGAHSYDGRFIRRANTANIRTYMEGRHEAETEILGKDELYDERVMLGLRTAEGICLQALEQDFGTDKLLYLLRMAAPHLLRGTLIKKGEHLVLARKGLFVSDDIISSLMSD